MSLTERLVAYFEAKPLTWIDARDLLAVAGFAGWRGRISECRRPPYSMDIYNRQSRTQTPDGRSWTTSEYRYVPRQASQAPLLRAIDLAAGVE